MQDNSTIFRDRRSASDATNRALDTNRAFDDAVELDDEAEDLGQPEAKSNIDLLFGRADVPAPQARPSVELPQAVEEEDAQPARKRKPMKLRHLALVASFVGCVVVPSTVATGYMTYIAADQYHSTASFSVRNIGGASAAGDIMGIFSQASGSNFITDSFILMDYIKSIDLLTQLEQNFDLQKMYARRGLDYYYGMAQGMSIESRLAYWRSVVDVSFDHSSGIITIELRAFNPQDAQQLTNFIISRGEQLINDLSNKARDEVLRGSRQEVARGEIRLVAAREELRRYRDSEQEIDPTQGAQVASSLVAGLEAKLTELNTSLATARQQMSEDAPRIRVLKTQIASLKDQIEVERQRVGSGSAPDPRANGATTTKTSRVQDVASRIQRFEALKTQEEFAQQAYAAALGSLEKARIQAEEKQRYLATFIRPAVSEQAQYPKRLLDSFLVTLALLFTWIAASMVYYNVRDRA